jgi:hypothetical protein
MDTEWLSFGGPLGDIEAEIDIIPLHNAGDEKKTPRMFYLSFL